MKRIVSALCLALAIGLLSGLLPKKARAAEQGVLATREGVARIVLSVNGEPLSTGSSFFVGEPGKPVEFIVTNRHVIEVEQTDGSRVLLGEHPAIKAHVVFEDFDSLSTLEATLVTAFQHDLAILRLVAPTTLRKPLTMMSSEQCEVTDTVYALGFPGVGDDWSGVVPSTVNDVTVTGPNSITKKEWVFEDGAKYLQHNVEINSGNSGGPLVNLEGHVVGINSMRNTQASATNYALYIDYAIEYFKTMGYSVDIYDRDAAAPTVSPTVAPVPADTPLTMTSVMPLIPATPAPESKPKSLWIIENWYWLVAGIVLLAGGAVAVALTRSGKKRRSQPDASPAQLPCAGEQASLPAVGAAGRQPSVAQRQLVAIGTANALNGRVFPLHGAVVIGRDPARCKILFPSKTPGVSSAHCQATETAEGILLVDLASSYGTFFENGTKLTPNKPYPLHTGDTFYLASRENGFQVQ